MVAIDQRCHWHICGRTNNHSCAAPRHAVYSTPTPQRHEWHVIPLQLSRTCFWMSSFTRSMGAAAAVKKAAATPPMAQWRRYAGVVEGRGMRTCTRNAEKARNRAIGII